MSVPRLAGMAVLCAVAFAPASCSKQSANTYQGWVEANLIFVAPDETGRVRTLTMQEGDTVKTGDSPSTTICSRPISPKSKPR